MKCKNCKTKIKSSQKFCPECGAEIKSKQTLSKKAQAFIACVCCLVFIVSGTIGGLYFYKSNGTADDYDSNYIALEAGFTDVKVTDGKSALEAISSVADVIGINNVDNELKISSTNTIDNDTYYRFQQYYNDIPVYGNSISLVSDNNKDVVALTSNFLSNVKVDLTKKTKSDIQIQNAIKMFLRKKISNDINIYTISEINESSRIIYNIDKPFLAFSISVITNYGVYNLIIDAVSGKVVFYTDETNYVQKEFKINGQNGEQSFTAETDGKKNTMKYISSSGTEITVSTPKSNNKFDWYYPDNSDIVTWEKDNKVNKSAVDMMTNITNIYYYYLNSFQRDSLDGNKIPLRLFVNTEGYKSYDGEDVPEINNAFFWLSPNGPVLVSTKNFENGKEIDEFSSNLDVLAHEYTHGVIRYTCALRDTQYNSFPGAINEGISDIFGILAEQSITKWSEPDWLMADDGRNIKDPHWNSVKHPYPKNLEELNNSKTFYNNEGLLYYYTDDEESTGSDFCHFACSIISHSAYLMWNGLNGNPEKKIDSNSLGKLWYSALFLMQSDATFSQCRNAVELSARIMLKNRELTQVQYQCVLECFDEVGIENAPYTYYYLVKNDFNLSVLNSKETDDVNFNLKVSKPSETELMGAPKLVLEENSLYGNKEIHLKDGVYYLEITDLDENAENSVPIKTKIIVDGDDENAADEVVIHTDFSDITTVVLNDEKLISNDLAYKEYAKIVNNLINTYGKIRIKNDTYFVLGLCYAELIDFNNDGIEELYVIYSEESDDYAPKYTYEVYGCQNSKIEKLSNGEPYGTDGGIKHAIISQYNNQKYVVTGGSDAFSFEYYYGFNSDGKFELIKSFECEDFSEGVFKIDGKEVNDSQWNKDSEEWRKNSKSYEIYEDNIEKLIGIINITLEKLGIEKFSNDNQDENVSNTKTSDTGQFYGNETAEQLRKSIIGYWEGLDVITTYEFVEDGTAYWFSEKQQPGTYKITDNKTLAISFPWTNDEYTWSELSFDEFHKSHDYDEYFWYMTDDGILMINGTEYYRDGKITYNYNTSGDLLAYISGIWISDRSAHKEYQINNDGTWIESTVVVSGGTLINRTKLDNGKVEIIDDTTAKLWQEVDSLSQIPGVSELIYDSKNDKVSIGGTNNTFTRAKYK